MAHTKYNAHSVGLLEYVKKLEYVLNECKEYFDQRADADVQGDPSVFIPNEEMVLLGKIDKVL